MLIEGILVQYIEPLVMVLPIVLFIPNYLLTLLYNMEMWNKEGPSRTPSVMGFLAFAQLSSIFYIWVIAYIFTIGFGMPMLSWVYYLFVTSTFALMGGSLIFLALWSLALVHPEWLYAHRHILAIWSPILWILFTVSTSISILVQPNIGDAIILLFLSLGFLFTLSFAFLKVRSDRRALLLFIGLLFFYFTIAPQRFGAVNPPLGFQLITMIGPWLVLGWYILTRKKSPRNKPPTS